MEQAQPAEQTSVSNDLLGGEFWRFIIAAPLLLELADNLAPYQFFTLVETLLIRWVLVDKVLVVPRHEIYQTLFFGGLASVFGQFRHPFKIALT